MQYVWRRAVLAEEVFSLLASTQPSDEDIWQELAWASSSSWYPWAGGAILGPVTTEEHETVSAYLTQHGYSDAWDEPLAPDRQVFILRGTPLEQIAAGTHDALIEWDRDARGAESRDWASAPGEWSVVHTSRRLDPYGATGLATTEDSRGELDDDALLLPTVSSDARVYEIRTPQDWVNLVELAAADVTQAKSHHWGEGLWYIPDWLKLSEQFDAVHLSINGFLDAAGLPQPVYDGRTVLSGWDPDTTMWLNPPQISNTTPLHFTRESSNDVVWTLTVNEAGAEQF